MDIADHPNLYDFQKQLQKKDFEDAVEKTKQCSNKRGRMKIATGLTLLKEDAQMQAGQVDNREGSRTNKNARMDVEVLPRVNSSSLLTQHMLCMCFPYMIYLSCYRNA